MSLQWNAHTMKSKESFTALLRDRVIPKAFSHSLFFFFFFYPQLILKQQKFISFNLYMHFKFKLHLRLLLSKDKYSICKLDFPQALLTMCHLEDSGITTVLCTSKQLNTLPGADFKEIMTAISLPEYIYFHCIKGYSFVSFYLLHSGKSSDFRNLILRGRVSPPTILEKVIRK